MKASFFSRSSLPWMVWLGVLAGASPFCLLRATADDTTATLLQRLPLVTLRVLDPFASEQDPRLDLPSDPATFEVCRTGPTTEDLTVHYEVGGTAVNGEDYVKLPGELVILAGSDRAWLEVTPLDDTLVEGMESVVVRLVQPDCLAVDPAPPGCYMVGRPGAGMAYVQDDESPDNEPPKVVLVAPPDGAQFVAPVDIRLAAEAADADGWVKTVEFFADGLSLGIVTNHPWVLDPIRREAEPLEQAGQILLAESVLRPIPIPLHPFSLLWSAVPAGSHELVALATDNAGDLTKSAPIVIHVSEPPQDPIVTVRSPDPMASEGCPDPGVDCPDTALFLVHRTGPVTDPLRVYYRLGGTALNGEDYLELPTCVEIPVGASTAPIVVEPIDDNLAEGRESVLLMLLEPPPVEWERQEIAVNDVSDAADSYLVGRAARARAVILDNDLPPNHPPRVRLMAPEDGQVFGAPARIRLAAAALDPDGQIAQVEFFEGDNSLGVVTRPVLQPAFHDAALDPRLQLQVNLPVYEFIWEQVPPGSYTLTAVATDDRGETGWSQPVEIKVVSIQPVPVVEIEATDPIATEPNPLLDALPDTATFTVRRSGPTDLPLLVYYRIGGTASNGADYETISGRVLIPAQAPSAEILIDPLDDELCEGRETVLLRLVPHPCVTAWPPPGAPYVVGQAQRARAVILDDEVCPPNLPPRVVLVQPQDGDRFLAPADIRLCAKAGDPDGQVVRVDFYAGTDWIGTVPALSAAEPELFCIRWRHVPPGRYLLSAIATDDDGAQTRSDPVRIAVLERPILPVVHIRATDPVGSENGDRASFTVWRNAGTNNPLTVYYRLGGTAVNGQDYERLSGQLIIPAGAWSTRLIVSPLEDTLVEGTEAVLAHLEPPLCPAVWPPSPACYRVGCPAEDVVFIRDNDTTPNQRPMIGLLSPPEGAWFGAPAEVPILAAVLDPDGWVPLVEFFEHTNKIGEVTMHFLVPPPPGQLQTFEWTWQEVPTGRYRIWARATDQLGATRDSAPVSITVAPPPAIPVVTIHTLDAYAREGTPNTAMMQIRRFGDASQPLTVHYQVGGTAQNGVDYQALISPAIIPAGAQEVLLPILAAADNLPEQFESVIVRLTKPVSVEPETLYEIGRPAVAAALIVDADLPRPRCHRLPDGLFHVCLPGIDGTTVRLLVSSDLAEWTELWQGVVRDGVIDFVDPEAPNHGARFYRVEPLDLLAPSH